MKAKNFPEYAAAVCADPIEQISRYKADGRGVMGYTCTYVPEEIIHAAGFIPVRMLGRAQSIQKADRYFQTYCCSQVRSLMEDALNSVYEGLDGVIFAHTCDTMQSFHDIFKKNNPDLFVKNMNFPSRIDSDAALRYAVAETRRFTKAIEEFTGNKIDGAALEESVELYNRNRELLDSLYKLHLRYPEEIPSVVLLHGVLASMYADKAQVNAMLSAYLSGFAADAGENTSRKRLMLIGSININEAIYEMADEMGATIADDDMCTGRRYFETPVLEPTIEGIARRYFTRPHCAAKHRTLESRISYMADLAGKRKIDAAVFLYLKFCDPHSFDYPDIRNALEAAGVRTQLIEVEQAVAPSGQIRTKLQAFLEMME